MLGLIFQRSKLLKDIKLLGKWGERQCEKFLKRKGLKTLTHNYACKAGEIDLIMVDSDRSIVFVEVKTRADEAFAKHCGRKAAGKYIKSQTGYVENRLIR